MFLRRISQQRGPSLGLNVTLLSTCVVLTSPLVVTSTFLKMRLIQIGYSPYASISGSIDYCGICIAYRRRISVLVISSLCYQICILSISLYCQLSSITRSLICLEIYIPSSVVYPPSLKMLPISTISYTQEQFSQSDEICRQSQNIAFS